MKVTCIDIFGNTHRVEKEILVQRPSSYGVYIRDNKILLVQNNWNFKWELPGGGIDKTESKYDGLAREFKEETGLSIGKEVEEIDYNHNFFYDLYTNGGEGWECYRSYFAIKSAIGNLIKGNGEDIQDAEYFDINKLLELSKKNQLNNINKTMLNKIIILCNN